MKNSLPARTDSELVIACAQIQVSDDCSENAERIVQMMKKAAKKGARLIHFPEGALSGYVKCQIKDWKSYNWELLDLELQKICRVAAQTGIWVVLGSAFRLPFPYRPFNSLFVIDDSGRLRARYDKRLISNSELKCWYTPGEDPVTICVDGWKFGLATCIEINFPELFIEYEQLGTDCILCSSYSDNHVFQSLACAHAAFTCNWFSLSVPANTSKLAGSLIAGPDGKVIKKGRSGAQSLLLVRLDKKEEKFSVPLNRARPWRQKVRSLGFYEPYKFKCG